MSECKFCGTHLTALNISDIEDNACHPCVVHIIEGLEVDGEDPELEILSNGDLDKILKTLFPTPMYLTNRMVQHHLAHAKRSE